MMEIGGRFTIIEAVGHGGVGLVYKCRDKILDKVVAVKILHPLEFDEQAARLHRECVVMAKLKHRNILQVNDIGQTEDGRLFIVMEYLEGTTLENLIERKKSFGVDEAVPIFIEICNGLMIAHENGILHRDVKPSNIMVSHVGAQHSFVKLLDFGIAHIETSDQRLTKTGIGLGTPPYMSPEQSRGEKLDARADVYSMGCLIFETLTGRPPFMGDSAVETILMHKEHSAPRLEEVGGIEYGDEIERIVARCLMKERSARYASVAELKSALEVLLQHDAFVEPAGKPTVAGQPVMNGGAGFNNTSAIPSGTAKRAGRRLLIPAVGLTALLVMVGAMVLISFRVSQPVQDVPLNDDGFFVPKSSERLTKSGDDHSLLNTRSFVNQSKRKDGTILSIVHGDISVKDLLNDDLIRPDMHQLQFHDDKFDSAFLSKLNEKVDLTLLNLKECKLTDSAVEKLSAFKNLRHLEIEDCYGFDSSSLEALKELTQLSFLRVRGEQFPDEFVNCVFTLKNLEVLHMTHCKQLTGKNLEQLSRLPKLSQLNLSHSAIHPKNLYKLKQLQDLRSIGVRNLGLGDSDLSTFLKLRVEELFIDENEITDRGLKELAKIPTLKVLSVAKCRKLTPLGKESFRRIRPATSLIETETGIPVRRFKEDIQTIYGP